MTINHLYYNIQMKIVVILPQHCNSQLLCFVRYFVIRILNILKNYKSKITSGVSHMIGYEINSLREELDQLIALGANFQEIYTMSIKLDKLIVDFYTQAISKK